MKRRISFAPGVKEASSTEDDTSESELEDAEKLARNAEMRKRKMTPSANRFV